MFEKLLSVLPYNPGLAHQMSFYGQRMREEAVIRRTGLVFLVLTFMVQFFAVLSPPQPTVADSTNDVIPGGISSAADGRSKCEANTHGFQIILHYYGVSCDAFNNTDTTTIHTGAQDYYSLGQNPTGSAGERSVAICNPSHSSCAGTLYWRHLSIWPEPREGPGGSKGWKALHLRNTGFYMLYNCANLVFVGIPSESQLRTPSPTPAPAAAPTQPAVTAPGPTAPTPPAPCKYNPSIVASSPACYEPCKYNPSIAASSNQCFPPCPYNNLIPATSPTCKACDTSASGQAADCVVISKTASNVTAGVANADGTTANPGDVIVYTLHAQNKAKSGVKGYTFQENLNDVMDYADLIDLHGGILGSDGIVVWPASFIASGQTSTVQITVKVKNPVPQTPTSTSDPAHFDLVMTNVYGNAINIKVPGSPVKAIETATTALPNTGPGASLFIAAAVVVVSGYFYGRARLLARESELAVKEVGLV